MNKYYYFFQENDIIVSENIIDTQVFTEYVQLTDDECEFYLANPNATAYEVKQLMLYQDMAASEDMKRGVELSVSDYSISTLDAILPQYKVQNAIISLKLIDDGIDSIYDKQMSEEILQKYNTIGNTCRNLFYQFKETISNNITIGQLNELEISYRLQYDEIKNSFI
jgi:hypothetical protein